MDQVFLRLSRSLRELLESQGGVEKELRYAGERIGNEVLSFLENLHQRGITNFYISHVGGSRFKAELTRDALGRFITFYSKDNSNNKYYFDVKCPMAVHDLLMYQLFITKNNTMIIRKGVMYEKAKWHPFRCLRLNDLKNGKPIRLIDYI